MGRTCYSRWWCGFQVDSLHRLAQVVAAADQVAKVFACHLGLCSELACLLFLGLELLDVSLEANANVVGWAFESSADFRADAQSVLVGVINGCQLLRQLCAESVRKRLWNRGQDVGYSDGNCK